MNQVLGWGRTIIGRFTRSRKGREETSALHSTSHFTLPNLHLFDFDGFGTLSIFPTKSTLQPFLLENFKLGIGARNDCSMFLIKFVGCQNSSYDDNTVLANATPEDDQENKYITFTVLDVLVVSWGKERQYDSS